MDLSLVINTGTSIARQVSAAIDEQHETTELVERGSTSTVFRVRTRQNEYILRVATPRDGKSASFESDYAIRRLLWEADQPVAMPIATDQSTDIEAPESWALDELREGTHPVRGRISSNISMELGRMLRHLHGIFAIGYGQLEDTRQRLAGRSRTPEEGMLSRFEAPWPFGGSPLSDHPAVQKSPALLRLLATLEPALISFVRDGATPAVIHSDLHERQLLQHDDRLTAVLDFNDAIVGRREWDFGSYLYFHGDACLSDLLDGYTSDPDERRSLSDQANLAAILIALHHGNRGVVLQRPHRIEAAARFLESRLR